MPTAPTPIDALPTPAPTRLDGVNFRARADALLPALPPMVEQVNAAIEATYDNTVEAAAAAVAAVNAAASLAAAPTTSGTSTASLAVGTGTKVLTTQTGKAWAPGQALVISSTATPSTFMLGVVTSYSGSTLTVEVATTGGSGTLAAWTIAYLSALPLPGAAGQVLRTDGARSFYGALTAAEVANIIALISFDSGATYPTGSAGAQIKALLAGQSSGIVGKATKADLDADLAHVEGTVGWVTNDSTPANNVVYRKTGSSGAGSWVAAGSSLLSTLQLAVSALTAALTVDVRGFNGLLLAIYDTATGRVGFGLKADGTIVNVEMDTIRASLLALTEQSYTNSPFTAVAGGWVDPSGRFDGILKDGTRISASTAANNRAMASVVPNPYPAASLIHVISYGQSLSIGAFGTPALSTTQPASNLMFDAVINPSVRSTLNALVEANSVLYSGHGETVLAGATRQFGALRANPSPMLANARGVDGQQLSTFTRGSASYVNLMADIDGGLTAAKAAYRSYLFGAVILIQGEEDENQDTSYAVYLERLQTLASDLDLDIRSRTGQTRTVPMLISQVSSHQFYNATPTVPLAQYQAAKNTPDLVVLVGPKYHLPYYNAVHLTNHGYRAHGCKIGQILDRVLVTGLPWRPLMPTKVTRCGPRSLVARFHVPAGALVFDTATVTDPNGQKGFEFVDDSGSASLASITLVGDNTVHFVTARDMGANPRLRYAYTGTAGANAGPTTGARGCLRDSDPAVASYADAGGTPYPLFNWCVHFEEPIL